jgi:RHS repeat-associated protein
MRTVTITCDTTAGAELGTSIGTSPAVVTTAQLYDAYGAVTARGATYGASGLSFVYTYDDFGRLRSVSENDNGTVVTTWYTYDNAGRLFRVCSTATCLASDGVTSTASETYVYDANGNRTSWLTTGASNSANVTSTSVDAQDRLLSFTSSAGATTCAYDALGRLATKTTPAGDVSTLTWEASGALVSLVRTGSEAANVTYRNDAVGRRIARLVDGVVTTRWLYAGIHPVAEFNAAWVLLRVFVYATRGHVPDVVMAREGGVWVSYRVVTDHLGSLRRVVRVSDGAVVQRMQYDAYGRVLEDWAASAWTQVPFAFAGGIYDRATKLVRFGAREYDAEIGQWIAKDPIGFDGGDANLYGYCWDNPIAYVDEDGHLGVFVAVLAVAALYVAVDLVRFMAIGSRERARRTWMHETFSMGLHGGPAGNDSVRPGVGPDGKAYNDDDSADFYHCMANCQAGQMGPHGVGFTVAASLCRGDFSDGDAQINLDSASWGFNHSGSSCLSRCSRMHGTSSQVETERTFSER